MKPKIGQIENGQLTVRVVMRARGKNLKEKERKVTPMHRTTYKHRQTLHLQLRKTTKRQTILTSLTNMPAVHETINLSN